LRPAIDSSWMNVPSPITTTFAKAGAKTLANMQAVPKATLENILRDLHTDARVSLSFMDQVRNGLKATKRNACT
jgi:hypothetical protein